MDAEPSVQRLKSMHLRTLDIGGDALDTLHHIIYETDVDEEFGVIYTEDLSRTFAALALLGRPKIKGEKIHA